MKIIEKIIQRIEELGLSQASVERRCGLAENRISLWKNGKGEPTASQALLIADLLSVPLRYLVDDSIDDPGADLTEGQRQLLFVAEPIGYDAAARILIRVLSRPDLAQLKEGPPPRESYGELRNIGAKADPGRHRRSF